MHPQDSMEQCCESQTVDHMQQQLNDCSSVFMKPRHQNHLVAGANSYNDHKKFAMECDDLSLLLPVITSAGFALAAWGDDTNDHFGPTKNHSYLDDLHNLSFPECLLDPSWCDDDDDENRDDDSYDQDGISDCLSVTSLGQSGGGSVAMQSHDGDDDDHDTLFNESDDHISWNAMTRLDPNELYIPSTSRKVSFPPQLVSNVCFFERAAVEHHKNMYYTVHELQQMVDDFVAQGGRSLLG